MDHANSTDDPRLDVLFEVILINLVMNDLYQQQHRTNEQHDNSFTGFIKVVHSTKAMQMMDLHMPHISRIVDQGTGKPKRI